MATTARLRTYPGVVSWNLRSCGITLLAIAAAAVTFRGSIPATLAFWPIRNSIENLYGHEFAVTVSNAVALAVIFVAGAFAHGLARLLWRGLTLTRYGESCLPERYPLYGVSRIWRWATVLTGLVLAGAVVLFSA